MIPLDPDSPQRSATRASIDAPVRMQFDDSLDLVEGRCYNISIGGMFLESAATRPKGSLVRFELVLAEGAAVRGLGEVVWAQEALPGRPAGLGLKFRFLEQRDRQAIFKLVSQHIKEKLARRPSMAEEPPVPDTPLARQRRATLLGEGVPSPEPLRPPEPMAPPGPQVAAPPVKPEPKRLPVIAAGEPIPPPRPLGEKRDRPLEERTWQQPTMPAQGGGRGKTTVDPTWLDDSAGFADEPESPRNEGPGLPLKKGVVDDWDDRPLGTSEPQHYLEDVDPNHFEHRPRTRPFPLGLLLAVVAAVLVLAVLGYFLLSQGGGEKKAEVIRIGTGPTATNTEPPPLPEPKIQRPTADPVPAEPKPAEPKPAEPKPAEPKPAEPKPAEPKPAEPKPAETKPAKEFERVLGISHRKASGGAEVVIETDGELPASRFTRSRLEGRELIKLFGVKGRYEKKEIPVGDKWIKGLRIGYHEGGPKGNEIHLVIDLASPSAKVAQVRVQGRNLIVQVTTD